METLLIVFIVVTSVAVVIQAGILVGLFIAVKKSTARMETLANEVHTRAIPTLDAAQSMITEYRPKLDTIIANASDASTVVKDQVANLNSTVTEVVDRVRFQVVRADDLTTRVMDRVEHATAIVGHTVVSPIQKASGVMQGITTGLSVLFGKNRRGPTRVRNRDDMFI
jgi:hypothetical protein